MDHRSGEWTAKEHYSIYVLIMNLTLSMNEKVSILYIVLKSISKLFTIRRTHMAIK
jgi:hypothetical protein